MTVTEVLKDSYVLGNIIKLPNVTLSKDQYNEVAKTLKKAGGKWKGGKTAGFVFYSDPTDILLGLQKGDKINIKKDYQFYPTPDELCDVLVGHAGLSELEDTNVKILEPSAGDGAIIKAIGRVLPTSIIDCYEIMPDNIDKLNKLPNAKLIGTDFLKSDSEEKYDYIIANPPFSNNQDIDHFLSMYERLFFGGKLVCVMSTHWLIDDKKKEIEFRTWVKQHGAKIIELESVTFKKSGTNANTCIVIMKKF